MGRPHAGRVCFRVASGILRSAAWVSLALVLAASRSFGAPRPPLDASAELRPAPAVLTELVRLGADPAVARLGTSVHVDERYGVPNIFHAARQARSRAKPAGARPMPEQAAREHLARLATRYRLTAEDVQGAVLRDVHDTGVGGVIVTLGQQVDGVEVFRDQVKLLMDRDLELIAVTGFIPGRAEARGAEERAFRLPASGAVARALEDFTGAAAAGTIRFDRAGEGGYELFEWTAPTGARGVDPIRVKRVLFHLPDDLVPAWYVEVMAPDGAAAYVVSARDGTLLFRNDLTCSIAYSYRVFGDATGVPYEGPPGASASPHPTGLPDFFNPSFVSPTLITLQNGPISTADPWLPAGATVTTGNHVDAYADIAAPDGFSAGDIRATPSSPNAFDYVYDLNQAPGASTTQRMASIAGAFYVSNFMHDWFYDAGFNEAARNTQTSNYGRGGLQGDPLIVKTQQYATANNAFLFFTADGASPRMHLGIYTAPPLRTLNVHSTASIAGGKTVGGASSNAAQFSVAGEVALPNPNAYDFVGGSTLNSGGGPQWVAISDLNNDKLPDLVTANYTTNDVSVMLNNGAGFATRVDYAMGLGPYTVEASDLNGDGWRDLICANFSAGTFSVRLGTGNGLFGPKTDFTAGSGISIATVGRLNNDAVDDIVTANYNGSTVSVFLGNGSGGFLPKVDYPTGANPNWVAVGDVNGDGAADLITANYGASTVSVLAGTGNGTFQPKVDYGVGGTPLTLALGDLDADGRLDVVTANASTSTLSVLINHPSNGFNAAASQPVPATPITVCLGDVNGDGLLDAAVCSAGANTVSVLTGIGNGTLRSPTISAPVGALPYGVAIGDLNGDGHLDLVSADFASSTVSVRSGLVTDAVQQCAPYGNLLLHRIVLIDGAGCPIDSKISAAEASGAVGVLIVSSTTAVELPIFQPHGIPAYCVGFTDATQIMSALRTGPVHVTMVAQNALPRDMALDNGTIAHEWMHQMSTRLVGDASGLVNHQGRQMGEGWSDFAALLLCIRSEHAATQFAGAYSTGGYSKDSTVQPDNAYYFGWRRYPYSIDMSKNPLTFRHIEHGVALPVGPAGRPQRGAELRGAQLRRDLVFDAARVLRVPAERHRPAHLHAGADAHEALPRRRDEADAALAHFRRGARRVDARRSRQ